MTAHKNRLASEASPYLLQHAHNPVDWYPWGPEALARARKEDRPILLSIGYAACHWCHVMERESFENPAIAKLMNELFVSIKVDREERPDLDQIYQLTVQLMGRSGGWPLTVFLTPDQRPFFAGTYFPPADRFGMSGFPTILQAVSDAYAGRRGEVEEQALELTRAIARIDRTPAGGGEPESDLLRRATRRLLSRFDNHHGGFGDKPKFPNTMALDVMLRRGKGEADSVCAESVKLALDRMRAGGIWDQLRGGFHRYSTDERWLVPHFEKMLYDNALLLRLYVDGLRVFGDERYAETARELVGYLFAEMRDPSGGFYASQDADSEGHEGRFFAWTLADLQAALGGDGIAFDVARIHFGITEEGNFEGSGTTVLSEARPLYRTAAILDLDLEATRQALARANPLMLAFREKRPRPLRDDKILASWNGLLIGSLADAGRALDEPGWVDAAEAAFHSIETRLIQSGRVDRYFMSGETQPPRRPGFLDDQAFTGNAALDLYEATGTPRYIAAARTIADAMIAQYRDESSGEFFFTPADGDSLITRTKDIFDQAVPSAASMAALLCLRLAEIADPDYRRAAEGQLRAVVSTASDNPFGLGHAVCVLDRSRRGPVDVIIAGDPASDAVRALHRAAFRAYLPNRNIVTLDPHRPETFDAARWVLQGKPRMDGSAKAFVCRDRTCSAPVTAADELERLLSQ